MNGQPADKAFARHALWEIARGLSALHARRMVHRDLKPENILLDTPAYFARLRITDFGTSEAVRHAAAQGDSGSPAYMSPEQIRGSCDTRADLYALGVIAYELVTGRRPFNGTPAEVLRGHLQRRPDWGKVPEKIRPVLARALAKNPDERYTHAYELAHDFDNVLADPHESNLEIQLGGYEAAAPELLARDPISGWQARRHEAGVQLTGRDAPAGTLPLAPDGVVEICSASLVSIAARDNRHLWLGLGANGFCHQAPLYGLPPLVVLRRFKGDAVTIEGGAQPSIAAYRWDGQVVARSPLVTPLAALLVVRDTLGEHIVGVDMQLRQVFFVEQESLGLRPAHLHVPEGIRTIGLQAGRLWLATQHGQQHFLTPAHY
jgi:hypothetical protein